MEQHQQQQSAVEEPVSPAAPPADAPRDVSSPAVRRRAWTEPRVRLWWLLGLGVTGMMLYVLGVRVSNWWAERALLNDGVAVQAVVIEARNDQHVITVPGKQMPPDVECLLAFEMNGKKYEVRGQLAEHMERGQHVITGPEKPVTLHVDPNDPTRWTDRTASPPFLSRQMIGVAIGLPIAAVLGLVAMLKRAGVLRVWRNGRAAPALVVGLGQTPVAPRSRAVRCTPADSSDKRVFTVYLPAGTRDVAPGDTLWVVRPADKPEPCYAAGWFERTPVAVALVLLALTLSPGCASKKAAPTTATTTTSASAMEMCDCCPTDTATEAETKTTLEDAMTQPIQLSSTRPAAAAATQPAATRPATTRSATTFSGTLRGGILAVGGETTGWMLETDDKQRVDVDVTKAADAAANLDGKRVTITGGMTTANWVERGEKPLLIADRIDAAK